MKTRIKNATVVLPEGCCQTTVLIEGTRIADIDPAGQIAADVTIDATGLYLLPGVIDDQVHFREPGLTHKEDLQHASRACAKGGVTTFFEMPNTRPPTVTGQLLEEKLALAATRSLVNYGFYIGATPDNIQHLQSVRRTPGIKIFIGSSTGDLLVDDQDALERIFADTTLPICAHCEDETTVRRNAARVCRRRSRGRSFADSRRTGGCDCDAARDRPGHSSPASFPRVARIDRRRGGSAGGHASIAHGRGVSAPSVLQRQTTILGWDR